MTQSSDLIHLVYVSAATHKFTPDELHELLSKARSANAKLGVSGMLLHIEGSFFQILEGPEESVQFQFERISADPRHSQLSVIIREAIADRSFQGWTMGYADMSQDDLAAVPGLNDFFTNSTCLTDLDWGRARKLLHAFGSGRWRQQQNHDRRLVARQ